MKRAVAIAVVVVGTLPVCSLAQSVAGTNAPPIIRRLGTNRVARPQPLFVPPSLAKPMPSPPPPGIYKSLPYEGIVVVPGAEIDPHIFRNPPSAPTPMPAVIPDLRLAPLRGPNQVAVIQLTPRK